MRSYETLGSKWPYFQKCWVVSLMWKDFCTVHLEESKTSSFSIMFPFKNMNNRIHEITIACCGGNHLCCFVSGWSGGCFTAQQQIAFFSLSCDHEQGCKTISSNPCCVESTWVAWYITEYLPPKANFYTIKFELHLLFLPSAFASSWLHCLYPCL